MLFACPGLSLNRKLGDQEFDSQNKGPVVAGMAIRFAKTGASMCAEHFEEMFLQIRTRTVLASLPAMECFHVHAQFLCKLLAILPQFEPMFEEYCSNGCRVV